MAKARLLLVDDDRLVLSTFGEGLNQAGYDVLLADNNKDGYRLAVLDSPPDLAILDINMPNITGIEMANGLKELGIPSIILSAFGDEDTVQKAVDEGVLGFLVKPISVENAIPTIEAALKTSKDISLLLSEELRLSSALETSKVVDVVVGMLMERYRLGKQDAFDILRKKSQTERRKVKDLALEVLNAWDTVNLIKNNE
ncbi:MAG: response regulator [Candidatus Thiodiazotropha endolucinida]|nr:response regulator [Candidatus Thiodiazotropha taylori]MCG8095259.1 response regulator [Candidatus Thiodiazotropha endolucinida]MCW4312317.1 response regulator [Candidatus Thiodiazotropha taylori]